MEHDGERIRKVNFVPRLFGSCLQRTPNAAVLEYNITGDTVSVRKTMRYELLRKLHVNCANSCLLNTQKRHHRVPYPHVE